MVKGELGKHTKNESERLIELSERKITRNQKRKNDIISNVNIFDINFFLRLKDSKELSV